MKLNSYKELIVWQKSVKLVVAVYDATSTYPASEKYGLTSQTQRAAVSIPSNIAEGATRRHLPEYIQFLYTALGSSAEPETQLLIGRELKFLDTRNFEELGNDLTEIMKMTNGLITKLKQSPAKI